jgi:cold shock CspA family protein
MQVPLEVSFENCEAPEAIRPEIEKHAKRLEKFHGRITSCKVAVIAPQTRHRKGEAFKIAIRIAMPEHKDILVTKTHGGTPEHERVMVAIKDAFGKAQRQIEDAIRKMRGQVKTHELQDHGRVSQFLAGEDYGFIETSDGREIYLHRNSVLDNAFDRLTIGSEVRFVEEVGEKGAQASTVRPRHDGACGRAGDLHDLPVGQIIQFPQHKHLAEFGGQASDEPAQCHG